MGGKKLIPLRGCAARESRCERVEQESNSETLSWSSIQSRKWFSPWAEGGAARERRWERGEQESNSG